MRYLTIILCSLLTNALLAQGSTGKQRSIEQENRVRIVQNANKTRLQTQPKETGTAKLTTHEAPLVVKKAAPQPLLTGTNFKIGVDSHNPTYAAAKSEWIARHPDEYAAAKKATAPKTIPRSEYNRFPALKQHEIDQHPERYQVKD